MPLRVLSCVIIMSIHILCLSALILGKGIGFYYAGVSQLGFCAFYCYDGILRERPFEMTGFAVGIFIIMAYVIVDYSLEGNQGDLYRLVR